MPTLIHFDFEIVETCGAAYPITAMYNRFVRNIHLRRLNHHYLCTSRGQFVPPVEQVRKVLKSLDSDIRPVPDGKYEVKVCKLCSKGNKDAPDNLWKLLINRDGSYHCYRCAEHGTFKGLKDRLMIPSEPKILSSSKLSDDKLYGNSNTNNKLDEDPSLSIVTLAGAAKASASYQPMDQKLAHSFTKNLFADMDNNDAPITDTVDCSSSPIGNETQHQISIAERARMVRHYLQHERKLSLAICERYGVGVSVQKFPNSVSGQWDDNTCVTFPWIDFAQGSSANGSSSPCIQRIKYRSLDTKGKQRILPKGGPWGFFGWHLVSEEQNTAITVTATASFASSDSDSDSTSSNSEDEIADNAIIITEGEYDALAVAQAISDYHPSDISQMWIKRAPVVSLPNGCNSLPVELIIKLEKFNKIYLWLDNDASGIAASQNFTKKLGIHRCYVVKPLENCTIQPKDANDILRYTPIDEEEDDDEVKLKPKQKSKVDSASGSMVNTGGVSREQYMRNVELMMEMVQQAQPVRHERVISFSDIKHDVLRSLIRGTLTQYDGTLCTSLPTLNEITKGFRRGELIVFSGPTGSGKTTLLSQMSIDFAAQGIPTLWGSFEITNVRLAEKMLHQYNESLLRGEPQDQILSASELSKPRKKRRQRALTAENAKLVADDFEQLPFKFMNFHGGSSLGDVLDAMDYAVYKNDIQHIILDNLQVR